MAYLIGIAISIVIISIIEGIRYIIRISKDKKYWRESIKRDTLRKSRIANVIKKMIIKFIILKLGEKYNGKILVGHGIPRIQ